MMFLLSKKYAVRLVCVYSLFGGLSLGAVASGHADQLVNTVNHKSNGLDLYLDCIKHNIAEKLGVLDYILKNKDGIYLEIGTGGDPIATLLSSIPDTISPLIIASDVDAQVLAALTSRHPTLNKYLSMSKLGPRLQLQQLDATNMGCFADNYLSGINASAVVHEVVSYAGGMQGLDSFFAESYRILKPGGVLIYRDPESVIDKNQPVITCFKDQSIKLFVHIFLTKFLDTRCGNLSKLKRKYMGYDASAVSFICFIKNESTAREYNYDEYCTVLADDIDFMRPYVVRLPRGLCREVERHYLTYAKECNPLQLIRCMPAIDSSSYFVSYLAYSVSADFDAFLIKNNVSFCNGAVATKAKKKIDQAIDEACRVIKNGIPLLLTSADKQLVLVSLLQDNGFEPSRYSVIKKDGTCVLDYRIFTLLYDDIVEQVFDNDNGLVNAHDASHAVYLKREGEETYCYYSDDELIVRVAEISLKHPANSCVEPTVLCPLSVHHTTFVPRLCYEEILKSSMDINDLLGYPVEIREGKRIIHFAKMPLQQALCVYQDIIESDPVRYLHLQRFVTTITAHKE